MDYFKQACVSDVGDITLCVDITGFIKPYMMFLLHWCKKIGLQKLDMILYHVVVFFMLRRAFRC